MGAALMGLSSSATAAAVLPCAWRVSAFRSFSSSAFLNASARRRSCSFRRMFSCSLLQAKSLPLMMRSASWAGLVLERVAEVTEAGRHGVREVLLDRLAEVEEALTEGVGLAVVVRARDRQVVGVGQRLAGFGVVFGRVDDVVHWNLLLA